MPRTKTTEPAKAADAPKKAKKAAPKKAADPYLGMVPTVLHVGGVAWNGTERSLVRCAVRGPLADKWLARIGNRMLTQHGHSIPFAPYHQVKASLQDKVVFDLAEGLKALSK